MQTLIAPTSVDSENEIIPQPATWNGQPTTDLLTPQEAATFCRIYQVPSTSDGLGLVAGDLVVAQPVAQQDWANVQPGHLYITNEQMPAYNEEPAYEAECFLQVLTVNKRHFWSLFDEGGNSIGRCRTNLADVLDMHHITRLIRPLPLNDSRND